MPPPPDHETPDDPPGVPGFRSWWAVYLFVIGAFLVIVALLAMFSRTFA